jgi:mono/diheme cytochrome c family protein
MNEYRSQRLEILIGTIATGLIVLALALYILLEPGRIQSAQAKMLTGQLNDSMSLYAENCSVCHGLQGEGIGSIPPLDNPALRTTPAVDLIKTISRGRFNTAMPAWSQEDGGPLSDYQITEMVALIQAGNWSTTRDRVINLGLAPLVPFTTEPDPVIFEKVGALSGGAVLQTAIKIFSAQCVSCHGADGLGTKIAPVLNDPKVREKTADELNRTITLGRAGTLMAGWNNVLTPEEISAMVTLVQRWDEVPAGAIPAPNVPIPTTVESIAQGSSLFTANCSRCHGPVGQGSQRAPAINVKSVLTSTNDQALQLIITNGVPGTAMPAWGTRMNDADIQAIVGFIRQWEAAAPEVATPVMGGGGGPAWRQTAKTAVQWWQVFDWRVLLGLVTLLALAFTLISTGYTAIKKIEKTI